MIKGIYNENEFYTNFYWDSKFGEDLRLKIGEDANAAAAISSLKGLEAQFWSLKEIPESDPKHIEALAVFYSHVFQALGYSPEIKEHQTSSGQFCSLFIDVRQSDGSELFAVLVGHQETGAFEGPPIFLNASTDAAKIAVDYDLSGLLQEEFQEAQNPPRWILIGAPNALFVVERGKWSFGRYLRIEWQEIFLQRDIKPYEFLFGVAAKKLLCPEIGKTPHDEFDENSHRHAFEITTELRESVRESIEALINEMIDLKKEGHQKVYSAERSDQYAKELTHDALYYAYRLLFLLYLEAQGDDSDLLPLKSEIYRNGYSLEKLLELDFIDIAPDSVESKGTFLFESLDQIFNLIYFGFEPSKEGIFNAGGAFSGFLVKGIKSDLFDPSVLKHLSGVKVRNGVLLDILKRLSLTRKRERGGRARSRVSYANLGINQLGAVYEGLLSYSGFFAQEDLHALKPASVGQDEIDNGKEQDQVYFAPRSLVEKYRKSPEKAFKLTDENLVLDGNGNPKIYKKGSFVYRLAGRDRQRLASYYTPETLTKCTVRYSLKTLFDRARTLDELWEVKILEPAMGSGAFLNESVNQLAERILELEVASSVGDLRSPKLKQKRLWEIKYRLISSSVYGVDLNPVAAELARFSLWLNCIGAGKEPPSFSGALKVGNSLIGARFKKGADGIFPWITLSEGMMNFGKRFGDFEPKAFSRILEFRTALLSSRLNNGDKAILAVQSKAENLLKELYSKNESDEKKKSARSRLKLCGDFWCSFFFLNGEDLAIYPHDHREICKVLDLVLDGGSPNSELANAISRISERERFFHWELEFSDVMASGGFDLILGNPPWVALEWHLEQQVEDFFPIPAVKELDAKHSQELIMSSLDNVELAEVGARYSRYSGYMNLLDVEFYSALRGVSKNTYKFFSVLAVDLLKPNGVVGLIHEDGIFEDSKGEAIRRLLFGRLRFHFHFVNQKKLFEIGNTRSYSVNVLGENRPEVCFTHIGNLFVPLTIDQCFEDVGHPSEISAPGIKDENDEWETRGHRDRVLTIDRTMLNLFARTARMESDFPPLLNLHTRQLSQFLEAIQETGTTVGDILGDESVAGGMLEAKSALQEKVISPSNARPKEISQLVLSAPHISRGSMFGQQTKERYENHRSYETVDLGVVTDNWLPRCLYLCDQKKIDSSLRTYAVNGRPYRSLFRLAYRRRFDVQSERCFYAAVIPPGVSHIDLIESVASPRTENLLLVTGHCMSLVFEGIARIKNLKDCRFGELKGFPIGQDTSFHASIVRRVLFLSSLTIHFDLLENELAALNVAESLSNGLAIPNNIEARRAIFRDERNRELVLSEIDALVALSLGLSMDIMTSIYQTLMPVLRMYDRKEKRDRSDEIRRAIEFFRIRGW